MVEQRRRSTLVKRKRQEKDLFFLEGRRERAAAGDETEGEKRGKARGSRRSQRERDVWSDWRKSGPRVGEGKGLQVSARFEGFSLVNCCLGRGIFLASSTHFTRGGTRAPSCPLHFCLILIIQAVHSAQPGNIGWPCFRWHLVNTHTAVSTGLGAENLANRDLRRYPHHHPP